MIVSKTIVIEGGSGVHPQNFFGVIFIQNGAILGNTYWYMCLDIESQKEGRLPIFELRCTVYSVYQLIHCLCWYSK